MRTLVVCNAGRFRTDLPHQAIAGALRDPYNVLWLDITDPDDEDIALLGEQFGFHPLAIEDAIRAHEHPKVDAYGGPGDRDGDGAPDAPENPADPAATEIACGVTDRVERGRGVAQPAARGPDELGKAIMMSQDSAPIAPKEVAANAATDGGYYFVVFYEAAYLPLQDHIETRAIGLFIGRNYLVTVHHSPAPHIADTISRWRMPGGPLPNRVSALVHALLDAMVDDYFPLMDQVADRVEDLEDTIFVHFDESSIETMFRLKKDLLSMRRIVAPERDVLNVLLRRQLPIFATEDVAYLQDIYDHLVRVTDSIDTYRDLLSSALDSYLSLQSNKLNQVMKVLTIGSIILMADALVTGFYGQNFRFFPELGWATGSFWSLILMAVITVSLVTYFKRKKWW